jgi:hypothetical protein
MIVLVSGHQQHVSISAPLVSAIDIRISAG